MLPIRSRRAAALLFLLILSGAAAGASSAGRSAPVRPTAERDIVHALNRLTFGPRPGDVERVARIGLDAWINQQLNPSRVDDASLKARLSGYGTLTLDSRTIARQYIEPARAARRARQATGARMDPAGRADRVVLDEIASAKLLRAVYSERQLQEVLADFWFNHFNVFARKGRAETYITEYEREAIRPHVLGRFRDLLEATARSPAMLVYLDNWLNAAPGSARGRRGLNENYARELLELHTLGVDGGYTQADVVAVARAFTGWTIGNHGFRFVRRLHDTREKVVLGHTIRAGGGEKDGERVLDILASHPSTATHIAKKLAQRFVSDTPPAGLVARAAARFRDTGGDLRAVVRTIVTSPEFTAEEARRAKVKTPLEFVASALRATGAEVDETRALQRALRQLGMPLYLCQPPTGYDETAERWVSSGALVNRMNVALMIADRREPGVSTPLSDSTDVPALRERLVHDALGGDVSASTRATIDKATTAAQTIALAIGSPEFQRR